MGGARGPASGCTEGGVSPGSGVLLPPLPASSPEPGDRPPGLSFLTCERAVVGTGQPRARTAVIPDTQEGLLMVSQGAEGCVACGGEKSSPAISWSLASPQTLWTPHPLLPAQGCPHPILTVGVHLLCACASGSLWRSPRTCHHTALHLFQKCFKRAGQLEVQYKELTFPKPLA